MFSRNCRNCWHFSFISSQGFYTPLIFTSNLKLLLRNEKNSCWDFCTFGLGQTSPLVASTHGPGLQYYGSSLSVEQQSQAAAHCLSSPVYDCGLELEIYLTGQFLNSSPPCSDEVQPIMKKIRNSKTFIFSSLIPISVPVGILNH